MFYLLKCFIQMKILLNNNDLNEALNKASNLGFIPTMGSLHKGHISLIKKSQKKCKKTLVSIFINPSQFNNKKDFDTYPRNNKKDLKILKKLKVNFVYIPSIKQIYNFKRTSKIKLNKNDKILCAKYRKGHFEGVIDVMDRLTNQIKPKNIFMGEKDFQQLYLVKKYIEKKYPTKVIACKTVRNLNKLALSSRNFLLSKKELYKAEKLIQNLMNYKKNIREKKNMQKIIFDKKRELKILFNINIEYMELRNILNLKKSNKIKNSKIFIAYYLNNIRLIDNI
ncbi:pantoate--beta-alanine ligase [Pelagibacterales bacterium SAG-MED01]|nr:pantoate--beta-alanine ligase [Pelagibacterales bacterium SAG-MED01]